MATEKIVGSDKRYGTLEALLADENISAIMICSPDQHHLGQIEMALAAGKHIFCEKPLLVPGQDMASLEEVFDLAEKKKLVITSCHPRRFDKPFLWLKSEVSSRLDFGRVISISFDFSYRKLSGGWKADSNLLLDHLNHEVDLMNFLFGIQGFSATKIFDSPYRYEVAGRRDDDITFHFMGTRCLESSKHELCTIRFERGEVRLDTLMGTAQIIDHEKISINIVPNLWIDYNGRLGGVMNNFHDQIIGTEVGYLSRPEILMNAEVGIILQEDGVRRVNLRFCS